MKNQKKKGTGIAAGVILLVVFGLCLFLMLITEGDYIFGGAPTNINTLMQETSLEKGQHVTIGVNAVVDWYAETKHYINGFIPAGTERHCLVWLDDGSFISLTVKGKNNISEINKLIVETNKYLYGMTDELPDKIMLEGEITSINPDIQGYYNEVLNDWGIDTYEEKVYYLTIDSSMTRGKMAIYLVVIILFIIWSIVVIVMGVKKKRENAKLAKLSWTNYGVPQNYSDSMQQYNNMYNNPSQQYTGDSQQYTGTTQTDNDTSGTNNYNNY
ncbi:MAG: hypothetical protein ACI4D8_04450 [Wujia sp.]